MMTISPLVDASHAVPTIARWLHDEWFVFDGRPVEVIERQLAENLNREVIPITFIARSDAQILGTVSVDISDLPPFDHLSPWLASLYVLPQVRGRGIGSALVRHAVHFARLRGVDRLYLWTPGSSRLYERCGWATFDQAIYKRRPITLMQFSEEC